MSQKNITTEYLKSLSISQLIVEIKNLCNLFPSVSEYYQAKSEAGEIELLNKYKSVIKKEFMPDRGLGKARLSVARKAVQDFIKIAHNESNKVEIMIYYVEMGVKFTNAYGDIDEPFYYSMENMFEKSLEFTSKNNLMNIFMNRFEKIISDTSGIGWGFPDTLGEMFGKYKNV